MNQFETRTIFDFVDLPQNTIKRQSTAVEQLCVLCGMGRRAARRLSKAVFTVVSSFELEDFVENSVLLEQDNELLRLKFKFSVRAGVASDLQPKMDSKRTLRSLQRIGERIEHFKLSGSPEQGFEISFSELLAAGFVFPNGTVIKQWKKVIIEGDWETAFGQLSRLYIRGRSKNRELRDGLAMQRNVLNEDEANAEIVLSLVASKTDNAVMILESGGSLEWYNQAFSRLIGLAGATETDANSISFLELIDTATRAEFKQKLSLGHSFSFSYSILLDPSEVVADDLEAERWFEFQLTPIRDEDNKVVRWIGIGADVTQRRQAELVMQAAKDMAESANRAKSDFLAMMSHEIRTPMNAIIGMTELTLNTSLSVDQREYLTTANNSAQSLLQILNDILDLSKVEAQKLELEQVDFNIADLTREILDTMSVLAQRKDLALRCNFPLDIHQQVAGDLTRLRQVLVNLVGNAIKFTSFGNVQVNVEVVDYSKNSQTLQFSVIDTGIGIPADKTARIFEAFFQSDASINRNFGGTGLGLSITSELIRLMGGRIWVESKLGKGSKFHFIVTFDKSKRQFVSALPDPTPIAAKKILVVDDSATNRKVVSRWLEAWNVECDFAKTARQAMKLLQESSYDLALLDVILPDMSGFDLAEFLLTKAAKEDSSPASIVMFSSDDRTATIEKCRGLGIEHYLIKPVSPKTLLSGLQTALGNAGGLAGKSTRTQIEKVERSLNVLVVDDHASNRNLICEVLRRRGHDWHEAASGVQAITALSEQDFDAVLMDVQMPDKDGLQTTAEIRQLSGKTSLTPIIAVTAYVTEEDRQRCLDAGMDDYLSKPIAIHDLLERVERWGNTERTMANPGSADSNLDDQLLIQDAPAWASQIAQTIVDSEVDPEQGTSVNRESNEGKGPMSNPGTREAHPFAATLARFGGDEGLFKIQVGFFLDEAPSLLSNIKKAVSNEAASELRLNAHRLKGLARTFDDDLAAELSGKLEEMGDTSQMQDAESTLALLTGQIEDLIARLSS